VVLLMGNPEGLVRTFDGDGDRGGLMRRAPLPRPGTQIQLHRAKR
jgi:hypothetical protein